jgi:hypothetical protein
MRVAANDVERILQAAAAAVAADNTHPSEKQSVTEVARAFERAKELMEQPLGLRRVRGRKSGVYREVLATSQDHLENGNRYVLCLVAYTQSELDRRRVDRLLPPRLMRKQYKLRPDGTRPETPWPVSFHHQWINQNRLERVA